MIRKLLNILHTLCTLLAAPLRRRSKNTRRAIARAIRSHDKPTVNTLADELPKDL